MAPKSKTDAEVEDVTMAGGELPSSHQPLHQTADEDAPMADGDEGVNQEEEEEEEEPEVQRVRIVSFLNSGILSE